MFYKILDWRGGGVCQRVEIPNNTPETEQFKRAVEKAVCEGKSLTFANMRDAYMAGANIKSANMKGANIKSANMKGANMKGANMAGVNMEGADMFRANMIDAIMEGADMEGAKLPHFQLPDGDLIGWKKVQNHLVKLRIPEKAQRTATPVGRKCRAEMAEVLWVEEDTTVKSRNGCKYTPGYHVYPDKYDDDWRVECSHGIHFFLTREEAEEW